MSFNDIFKSSFLENVSEFSVLDTALGLAVSLVIGSALIGVILLLFANRKVRNDPYILVLNCTDETAELRGKNASTDFVNTIANLPGVGSATLVSYNGEYLS